MNNLIISWIGETDLAFFEKSEVGPVEGFLHRMRGRYEQCFLLFNYDSARVMPFLTHLSYIFEDVSIQSVWVELTNPTSYIEVYPPVFQLLHSIRSEPNFQDYKLQILLSPGTPTMQAVWVLLAKTHFPATCWQGYRGEYNIAELPFKLDLEFIQQANSNLDKSLERSFDLSNRSTSFDGIIGESEAIQKQIQKAKQLAKRNVPVLILGPTGSGKEVFAKAIHHAHQQNNKPFVAVNCGALPSDLAESILFGHKKGAFTGAIADQLGVIQQAHTGTLFLDEIGELSLTLQVKLLRVLQEKTFRPIGAKQEEHSDFRLICATHRDLLARVLEGHFREDLFYRIAIGVLHLPSLSERGDDAILVAEHLLAQINDELSDQEGYVGKKFSKDVIKIIKNHAWMGNIRELRATILRVCAWSEEKIITAESFEDALIKRTPFSQSLLESDISHGVDLEAKIRIIERYYFDKANEVTGGQITKMARLLGFKNHQTLRNRMAVLEQEE